MLKQHVELNFCRRCGAPLKARNAEATAFMCEQGHEIFFNAASAVALLVINDKQELLVVERAINPGKGHFDVPGGFCDGAETLLEAIHRELQEEVKLNPDDYSEPEFIESCIDLYDYKGEVLPVLGVNFKATLRPGAIPQAGDDAASFQFIPIKDIDLATIYFPGVRASVAWLQAHLS